MTSFNLIGQEKATEQLSRFLKEGIPQSLLFYGPEGVGKKRAAQSLVQTALCEEKKEGRPCQTCSSCTRLLGNNHPNCHLLVPDGTSHKIEAIRQLLHLLSFKPYEEGSLFVLIDEAEKMTEAAANALLKTLEEPPPSVIFILITAIPGMLPATILSRCQKVAFQPLSGEWLEQQLIKEGVSQREATLLSRASDGSFGLVEKMRSSLQQGDLALHDFFDRFPKLSPREITLWVEKIAKDNETTEIFLTLLRHHLREKIKSGWHHFQAWKAIDEAERAIKGYSPRPLTLEVLLHRIVS